MPGKRSSFYVNGVALNVPGVRWVTDEQRLHGPDNINMVQVQLAGRSGEVPIPATHTVGASTWEVSITIQGRSYEEVMLRKGQLEGLLAPPGELVRITEKFPSGREWTAEAYLVSSSIDRPWNSQDDGVDLTYSFRIPSGVWLEPPVTVPFNATGTYTVDGAKNGSAPIYDVTVTLNTSGSDVAFTIHPPNSISHYIGYRDKTNQSGRVIDINNRNSTAYVRHDGNRPIRATNNLQTSLTPFFIGTDGAFTVSQMRGVSSGEVKLRRAWY